MTALAFTADDRRHWSIAGAIALAVHVSAALLVLNWVRPAEAPVPEPVVMVELPPEGASAPSLSEPQPITQPQPLEAPQERVTPPIDIPPVHAPLPSNPVILPPPAPKLVAQPASTSQAPAAVSAAAAPTGSASGSNTAAGNDPKAKKQEADYFALVSAHLNRRKVYPPEARKARQQGVVTVRFTVDRNGGVSGASIKRSSGHDILDRATLDLLQRVAPLPRMPSGMQRQSITLSLPIDYSLRTN